MEENLALFVLIVVVLGAIAAAGLAVWRKRRTRQLKERYGPEYDRALRTAGAPRRAEAELAAREKRVSKLDIHPLTAEERASFLDAWEAVQRRFVDDPAQAVAEANRLVTDVMVARGYPMTDFEQRAADVSVDHPRVVTNYRAARAVAAASERGQAGTEDERKALIHYRALFEELLEVREPETAGVGR